MLSRVPHSFYYIPRARPAMSTRVSKRVKTKAVEVVKDYELMREICKDLLEKGILGINEMANIIKLLNTYRSEWSKHEDEQQQERGTFKIYPHRSRPDIENRKLTDDEIEGIDKDIQLVIKYGGRMLKSTLLILFKTTNPRFKECVTFINVKKKVDK